MPRVVVKLYGDGRVEMDGQNFSGKACERTMHRFAAALGVADPSQMSVQHKPEYYQEAVQGFEQQSGG